MGAEADATSRVAGGLDLVPALKEREVVERIHQMYASGMSQEDICNALTNERVYRRNGRWFPVVIRRALAARERGFPDEPIPDGVFRSRSKQFRRSRKVDRSVP